MSRVAPNLPEPTNHFSLGDRLGRSMGLTICDEMGIPRPLTDERAFVAIPVETTAQKQTSGSSSYADFDYPYSPIVQDDFSGGRANLDFERDSTKYYDSFRARTGRANKAYAGPLEVYAKGLRGADQNMPGSTKWVSLHGSTRYIYKRFRASASYTVGKAWLLARKHGTPGDLTFAIYSDNAGALDTQLTSITVSYTRMDDTLMEWLNETISQVLVSGTYYWIVINGDSGDGEKKHWKIACNTAASTSYYSSAYSGTPTAATEFDLYFRLCTADAAKTCIPFEYKEQQYFVVSPTSGAPEIFMAGDRGTADSNAGTLNKLLDGTKSWTTDEWIGTPVLITDGTGKLEPTPYRTVTGNTGSELTFDTPWTITHDTTTEYVILGTKLRSLGACGLTAPVTDVYVSTKGVIYFCMGDGVTVRRMRAVTITGVWYDLDNAANCQADETAATKAVFMTYKPQAQRIAIANNSDAAGDVSIALNSNTTPNIPVWGTALTWATAIPIDSKYRRITGLIVYPDISNNEAVWVFKTDVPFTVADSVNPRPISIDEMKTVRSYVNGVKPMRHGVYLYFPMLQGLERYYGGQIDDIGPNLGEGLPPKRRGSISHMIGYPGKFFISVDAGSAGYSSVLDSDGWHERYRAPYGQRITAMSFQTTPGTSLDRLWIYQGNDLIYLPFPSSSVNELEDATYPYVPEFSITLARMHAGMFDVQKLVKNVKLQTEALETDPDTGEPICWFELDYRLDEETDWQTIDERFLVSPTQEVDFTPMYGIAAKRLQFRLRGYTTDQLKTPNLLAIIVSAVLRVDVKNMYGPFNILIKSDEVVGLRETDKAYTAWEKLKLLEDWADASNDSMLFMRSVSEVCDGKMIFLNMGTRRQVKFVGADQNQWKTDLYIATVTMQEA